MSTKKILFAEGLTYSSPKQVYVGSHQYARRFAKNGFCVGWLGIPVTLMHFIRRRTWDVSWSRVKIALNSPLLHYNGRLVEIQPLGLLPYQNKRFLGSHLLLMNFLLLSIPSLKRHLRSVGLDKIDILWIATPSMAYIRDIVQYKLLVYRVADIYQESPFCSRACKELDIDLLESADAVIVASRPLYEDLSKTFSNVYLIPNGIDEEVFTDRPKKMPLEYELDHQPKVVFAGAVREWFDKELLLDLATAFSEVTFYAIGHYSIDISSFSDLRNVHFLGPKGRYEIPSYLVHADVGIIPFRKSKFVDQIDPIKLYEYAACGLPVISSPIQALNGIDLPFVVANGFEQFSMHLRTILKERPRIKVAMNSFTWTARFKQIMELLEPV